jgi:hypothetical protein
MSLVGDITFGYDGKKPNNAVESINSLL